MARKKPLVVPPKGTVHQPKQVTRGFSFRFYPNQAQQEYLKHSFGCTRFVYNKLLEQTKTAYSDFKAGKTTDKPDLSKPGLSRLLTQLKHHPEYPWLQQVSATALQESCFNLATAYKNGFTGQNKLPTFKYKYSKQSISFTVSGFSIEGKYLKLAKLDTLIKLKLSRQLPSAPTRVTITKTPSGEYYASFACTYTPKRKAGTGTIGIDVGITDLATFSDGTTVPNPRHFLKLQRKLAIAQRRLSKKKKGSKNRQKQQLVVARIHSKIANQRSDYLHKLTTTIVSNNQAIAIEQLQVSNMLRNHKLAKHIADVSWSRFRELLTYKVEETSTGYLFLADPYYPSTQLCSACGTKPTEKLKLSTRKWTCGKCGTTHQRDHNAAMNLKLLADVMLEQCQLGVHPGQLHLTKSYEHYVPQVVKHTYRRSYGKEACGDRVQ